MCTITAISKMSLDEQIKTVTDEDKQEAEKLKAEANDFFKSEWILVNWVHAFLFYQIFVL